MELIDGATLHEIWIRMLAGGGVLQLTRDNVDHTHPRWAPDSSTLIYHTPPPTESEDGIIWEIGALGGWPRKITTATIAATSATTDGALRCSKRKAISWPWLLPREMGRGQTE